MTKTHVTPNGATLTLDEAHVKTGIPDLFATRDPANGKWMLLVHNLGDGCRYRRCLLSTVESTAGGQSAKGRHQALGTEYR